MALVISRTLLVGELAYVGAGHSDQLWKVDLLYQKVQFWQGQTYELIELSYPSRRLYFRHRTSGSEALLNLMNLLNGNESDLMSEGNPLGNP